MPHGKNRDTIGHKHPLSAFPYISELSLPLQIKIYTTQNAQQKTIGEYLIKQTYDEINLHFLFDTTAFYSSLPKDVLKNYIDTSIRTLEASKQTQVEVNNSDCLPWSFFSRRPVTINEPGDEMEHGVLLDNDQIDMKLGKI